MDSRAHSQGVWPVFQDGSAENKAMKKLIATVAVVLGVGAAGSDVQAGGGGAAGCSGPFCSSGIPNQGVFSFLFEKKPVPAFQAAPWYLYWPYHAHFMTPAPLGGAYYGPPAAGAMVNPYFPANPAYYPTPAAAPAPAPTYTTAP